MPTKRMQEIMDLRHPSDKKASKPLMEKRRRARINHCLAQLKTLIVDPSITERSRQTKLEKADILELTVRHLHEVKRQQRTAALLNGHHPRKKFEIGYAECAREVDIFLSNLMSPQITGLEAELQSRLKNHLYRRLQDLQSIEPLSGDDSKQNELTDEDTDKDSRMDCNTSTENSISPSLDLSSKSIKDYCPSVSAALEQCDRSDSLLEKTPFTRTTVLQSHVPIGVPETERNQSQPNPSTFSFARTSSSLIPASPVNSKYNSTQPPYRRVNKSNSDHYLMSSSELSDSDKEPDSTMKTLDFDDICLTPKSLRSNSSSLRYNQNLSKMEETLEQKSDRYNTNMIGADNNRPVEQISLVPKLLPDGEWALVLPSNFLNNVKGTSTPFSAFHLVWPAAEAEQYHRQQYTSSPATSDCSSDERHDGASRNQNEHAHNELLNCVWRPW